MISAPTAPVTSEEKVSRSSYLYRNGQVYFWFLVRPLCGAESQPSVSALTFPHEAALVLCTRLGSSVSPLLAEGREKEGRRQQGERHVLLTG